MTIPAKIQESEDDNHTFDSQMYDARTLKIADISIALYGVCSLYLKAPPCTEGDFIN
jgi:hypothetical protein